ncbi:hypothetical protein ABZ920_24205 [Streptomyces sp. NPDC046831]|uniref:hypothetical protein n=1 Tax=Streptomyces sp. NPDC046831 TaxID=3154805 RepID=UPI0033F70760
MSGRRRFLTGATSGTGLAVTELLAHRGVAVFGVARGEENMRTVVRRLREEGPEVDGGRVPAPGRRYGNAASHAGASHGKPL